MDGLPSDLTCTNRFRQRTLRGPIDCVGIGLHTGRRIRLALRPAPAGSGIVFYRTDLGASVAARHDCVIDTRLCTVLADPARHEMRVGTVEHVMAALAACGVDNAVVAVDGPEVPILDGSAAPFVFLIDCAGVVEQDAPLLCLQVLRPVRVTDGQSFAELRPAVAGGFETAVSIDFTAAAIGRQALSLRVTEDAFRRELAEARTFTLAAEIAAMREAGLARGGSLDNAVVVDDARVLNPAGLRRRDEFVRHKVLDIVGDLALAGAPLEARLVAHRPGHGLNNKLLRALFADRTAWTWRDASAFGWSGVPAVPVSMPA
jgi:UDP-3-O-[3-hydroxymyristoyl] N-acetylglucosamine deacetylase